MGVDVDPKTGNPLGNVPKVLQFQNNFIPSQTTTSINYAANLPSTPTTAISSSAATGTINGLGGLNPLDFIQNPTLTTATGYNDTTTSGTAALAGGGGNIDGNTTLSTGVANNMTTGFTAGNSLTIDGQTLTFVASGATGPNQINVTDNISTLLSKIDALTGATTPSTISGGVITLHTGTVNDLNISASGTPATSAATMTALGFSTMPIAKLRTVVTSPPTGAVIANDQQTFLNEFDQRRRRHRL